MAFKITTKQTSGKQVVWKFENTERQFTSDVERFKRNVEFWKGKLMIGNDVQVEILEGLQWLQDLLTDEKHTVDVQHEEITELETELYDDTIITSEPAVESLLDQLDPESSVYQSLATPASPAKRAPRKKATDL